jgi:hypothetical protein
MMFLNIKSLAVLSLLFILLPAHAYSITTIYTWKDSNGVSNYGDDPSNAPAGAKVAVFQSQPETRLANLNQSDSEDSQPSEVTQGLFAVELVKELGLKKNPSPQSAAKVLTEVRIAPPQGRWDLNQPMTPELTTRLRQLTVASTKGGWLGVPEDQALLAFDTSAAVLGLGIPGASPPNNESSDEERAANPSIPSPNEMPNPTPFYNPSEAIYTTFPILAAPPLVTFVTPFPDFYPYYYWYPVLGGFWAGSIYYSGYYVLNTHRFFHDHYGYNYNNRMIGPSPRTISGQIQGRIIKNQLQSPPRSIQTSAGSSRTIGGVQRLYSPVSYQVSHRPSIRSQNTQVSSPLINRSAVRSHASSHGRSVR